MTTAADTLTLTTAELTVQSVMSQGIFPFWEIHEAGIQISAQCPEEDWRHLATIAAQAFQATGLSHCRMMAKLADCLTFGFNLYGERASDIVDATAGYMKRSVKTLDLAMDTFMRIPEENRRVDELTLEHHKLVAPLTHEEQKEFLKLAIDEGLSVSGLKEHIRERHPKKSVNGKKPRPAGDIKITEDEALLNLDSILTFFEQQEEEHGSCSKWPASRKKAWEKPLREIVKVARRFVIQTKGKAKG